MSSNSSISSKPRYISLSGSSAQRRRIFRKIKAQIPAASIYKRKGVKVFSGVRIPVMA